MMEKLLLAPNFQVTLAAVVGIGVVTLGLAVLVFKFFLPSLGRALLSPALQEGNINGTAPAIINPALCTACLAEHERSIENKDKIDALFSRTAAMGSSLGALCVDMAVLKTGNEAILKAVNRLENNK